MPKRETEQDKVIRYLNICTEEELNEVIEMTGSKLLSEKEFKDDPAWFVCENLDRKQQLEVMESVSELSCDTLTIQTPTLQARAEAEEFVLAYTKKYNLYNMNQI